MKKIKTKLSISEIDEIFNISRKHYDIDEFDFIETNDSIIFINKNIYSEIKYSSFISFSEVYNNCITIASSITTTVEEVREIYDIAVNKNIVSITSNCNITTITIKQKDK